MAKTNQVETNVNSLEVQHGEVLDFVTDCQENVTSDSFEWVVTLKMTDASGRDIGRWESDADFHGPLSTSVPQQIAYAWRLAYGRSITVEEIELACQFIEQQKQTLEVTGTRGDPELISLSSLCQQLLSSNEFLYSE